MLKYSDIVIKTASSAEKFRLIGNAAEFQRYCIDVLKIKEDKKAQKQADAIKPSMVIIGQVPPIVIPLWVSLKGLGTSGARSVASPYLPHITRRVQGLRFAPVLEYAKWDNFHKVIKRAMIACENA